MPKDSFTLDETDVHLLQELQRDADRPLHELGEIVGLSPSATSRRITGYKSSGMISRTVAVLADELNRVAVEVVCHIICFNDADEHLGPLKAELAQLAEVSHCYEIAGTFDLIAVFAVEDMASYVRITDKMLKSNTNVQRFESHVVLDVVKKASVRNQFPR